jgi:hypothetical protein
VFFVNIFFFLITGVNRRFITNSEGVFSRHDIGISQGAGGSGGERTPLLPPYTQNLKGQGGGGGGPPPPPHIHKTLSTSRETLRQYAGEWGERTPA